eukprot:scaffold1_cov402-Prasinococcus_capsulatus_cf.AAC.40
MQLARSYTVSSTATPPYSFVSRAASRWDPEIESRIPGSERRYSPLATEREPLLPRASGLRPSLPGGARAAGRRPLQSASFKRASGPGALLEHESGAHAEP